MILRGEQTKLSKRHGNNYRILMGGIADAFELFFEDMVYFYGSKIMGLSGAIQIIQMEHHTLTRVTLLYGTILER